VPCRTLHPTFYLGSAGGHGQLTVYPQTAVLAAHASRTQGFHSVSWHVKIERDITFLELADLVLDTICQSTAKF
jgi:hypothetical protein